MKLTGVDTNGTPLELQLHAFVRIMTLPDRVSQQQYLLAQLIEFKEAFLLCRGGSGLIFEDDMKEVNWHLNSMGAGNGSAWCR